MALQPFLANRATCSPDPAKTTGGTSSGTFQRLFDETARTNSGEQAQTRADGPKVDVIEENGRVSSIVVTCRCCERIELSCRY